jgi:regulator of sigma E protease
MLGGVSVNVILAFLIYVVMLQVWGEQYLPTSEVNKYGIACDSLAMEMGLQDGDKILSVDGKYIEDFLKISSEIVLEEAESIQVERNGESLNILIPEGFISKLIRQKEPIMWPQTPFEIASFAKESPARDAGIQQGDRIIGINDNYLPFFYQFRKNIENYRNTDITLWLIRDGDTLHIPMSIPETGLIGVASFSYDHYFDFQEKTYKLGSAITAGAVKAYNGVGNYLKSLRLLFSQEKAYESVGGFIAIGDIFPAQWDWHSFWSLTAFLSIMLAILNVLPIPALDGGHVMFLIYEIISGRKPSDKFLEYAQIVGMILLFALLIFANGNDIIKLFR